jgi:DeoR/GlpR family transcriptional regulator of sugar metabolism
VSSLRTFNLDTVFIGVHGMHERAGFSTPNLLEADTNRAFVDATDELVVLADNTKWGVAGLATFADLEEATVCITDDALSEHARSVLQDRVGRLVLSSPDLVADQRSA